ncbi:putative universal stress protein UspA [Desulfamplus magnetovallimortis]|uniref:Putative universal stress protein UspA n=1 Tax=Desulfamplus magnetovallimortis TaxID=1246637 RepID=A0A1W1HBC0_9BACT|nr:universal stress protein [Desulfamplus magnetovallimortis]SLM29736.1 putative universal stress protein UspA [Desulfamplus magnetovallimortis]
MEKHILITISEDKSSLLGVRFAGYFFADKQDIKITLFNTAPKPPAIWDNERSLESDIRQQAELDKIHTRTQKTLENAEKELLNLDFMPDNITQKFQDRLFSKIGDIIHEGEKGLYDAVILGRRGLSILEKMFDESVSEEIFQQPFTFPLWLCRSVDPSRKNVLLYVDGSDTSFRMADHVGFILNKQKQHRITILVMDEQEKGAQITLNTIKILIGNGFPEDLIDSHVVKKGSLAKYIMDEAEQKKYAAVALGRSGGEKSLFTRIFKGEVCHALFRELEGASLWVCN